ncbi:hypothetical protein FB45DRAFT_1064553 [Roridomyces roridus]|uniref:F-box domain-containing protein n=1 Tax=Roridomyces roridus TaxID=1738132 RepID=A0AAD7BAK0_9AGAR|nr:hypothetical protein FB45DRAFT_1064553 [Roridomyces roridus]
MATIQSAVAVSRAVRGSLTITSPLSPGPPSSRPAMRSFKKFFTGCFTPSVSRRRVSTAPRAGQDLLPIELWDEIFSLLTDEDLLRAARVSKPFNILCIRVHVARHKLPSVAESQASLQVKSAALPALQLSCTTLGAERLFCHFDTDLGIQRGLEALATIIGRSGTLRRVDLKFNVILCCLHERDTSVPQPLRSRWRIMHKFCGALSAMALKAPAGKVVVIARSYLYEGHAVDVAGWNWHSKPLPPKLPLLPRRLFRRNTRLEPSPRLPCMVPRRSTTLPWDHVYDTESVSMHSSLDPQFTLFVFNDDAIEILDLRHSPISSSLLFASLRTLEFPALVTLIIPDGIVSHDWAAFLLRHPALRSFAYMLEDNNTASPAPGTIHCQPIAHPGLREITAWGISNIERAMTVLGSSPSLSVLRFAIYPSAAECLRDLIPTLGIIAQLPAPVSFTLEIKDDDMSHSLGGHRGRGSGLSAEHCLLVDDEVSASTRALHCIDRVTIRCSAGDMARAALKWLALLPALRLVEFDLYLEGWPQGKDDGLAWRDACEEFRRTAVGALHGVEFKWSLMNRRRLSYCRLMFGSLPLGSEAEIIST